MEKSYRRIVFLDIDSVVNSENWYEKTKGRSGDFDPDEWEGVIELANELIEKGM